MSRHIYFRYPSMNHTHNNLEDRFDHDCTVTLLGLHLPMHSLPTTTKVMRSICDRD